MYIKLHSDDKIALKMFAEANFKFVERHVSEPSLCCPELLPTITYDVSINNSKELEKLFTLLDVKEHKAKLMWFLNLRGVIYTICNKLYENLTDLRNDVELLINDDEANILELPITSNLEVNEQTYRIRIVSIKCCAIPSYLKKEIIKLAQKNQDNIIQIRIDHFIQMRNWLEQL